MANPNELQTKIASGTAIAKPAAAVTLATLLSAGNVKARFEAMLGAKAAGFMSSLISLQNQDKFLAQADPRTILSAAAMAASLDLPVNKNLGFAWIIAYKGKAEFQMGYKGFIQLAIRSGEYKTMNTTEIYEDEIKLWNPLTGEIVFTPEETWKQRDAGQEEKIVGYMAFLKLMNGFEKYLYMKKGQVERHARKYSQSYGNDRSKWKTDFNAMALKTVIKLLLSKWGILSVDMRRALRADQAVIKSEETRETKLNDPDVEYIDVPGDSDADAPAPAASAPAAAAAADAGTAQEPD